MTRDDSFLDYVLEQLADLDGIRSRAMFGGHGIYLEDAFFGILHRERLYFKTREGTRDKYVDHGMGPFRPNERQTLKNYYEVPVDILEDRDAVVEWALEAARQS